MTTLPDYLAAVAAGLRSLAPALRDVAVGQVLTRDDVALDDGALEVRFRGEMEAAFGG